ncbi:fam-a protein [Plasmodium chabaudi chabaudi]|uniref:Fam-a protein n=1 Tax=Plasmodium chabaudi chabaudi TaxID=31271 RepID=A0A4V0KC54_PLACU|nr:fam-a protein [Plasmodium chabaudi chabaudi]VTZ70671.1 fam-a protein [Plasmodium chabaudi chabaudi]|eukprot:XP_016652933.1 fam-a protein [Plasmodium chabaudi chabaudi]
MNKRYITIALTLLSLAGYMQNVAFASETASDGAAEPANQTSVFDEYDDDMICENLEEASIALDHAKDSSTLLLKLAENMDGYSINPSENENIPIYSKKIGNIDIGMIHVTIPSASKYTDVINTIWDYNDKQKVDDIFIIGYLARVYTPFLVIMEQSSIYKTIRNTRKRFAVAAKIKVSNDTTVIVCPTRTINFFGTIVKKTNLIEFLENTKPIETYINAEKALAKLGSNIAGYIIKHRDDNVEVTYINAICERRNFNINKIDRDIIYATILDLVEQM